MSASLLQATAMKHALALSMTLLIACGSEQIQSADGGPIAADAESAEPFTCAPPLAQSKCGNPASIVQGRVRLPNGTSKAPGTLVIAMLHRRYGDPSVGGHPHWIWRIDDALVTDGYARFEVDMCDGNATMWSEENCEYNLVAFFDANANNGPEGPAEWIPDQGEATVRHSFDLSCHSEGATCLDLELTCMDGETCLADKSPGACECKADSCESQAAICKL